MYKMKIKNQYSRRAKYRLQPFRYLKGYIMLKYQNHLGALLFSRCGLYKSPQGFIVKASLVIT